MRGTGVRFHRELPAQQAGDAGRYAGVNQKLIKACHPVQMVDTVRRQQLNLPVAPLVAAVIGGGVALAFALVPTRLIDPGMIDGGVAGASPAGAVLILMAGVALIVWFGLFLLGDRAIVVEKSAGDDAPPVLRRADAHPDAPARRPLSASRELGTPFLEVRAHRPVRARAEVIAAAAVDAVPVKKVVFERALPADLDLPLAAYDPGAIPAKPVDRQPFEPGLRVATADLTQPVRAATFEPAGFFRARNPFRPVPRGRDRPFAPARPFASALVEKDPSASIHALLDRLEHSFGGRETIAPPLSRPLPHDRDPLALALALGSLRRLGSRG